MQQTLTSIWSSAYACFLVTPVALVFAGILATLAVQEAFSNFADGCRNVGSNCHEPRDLVMVPLALACVALVSFAAATLGRGAFLTARGARRRLS
jgi:hypothetical protein